MDNSVPEERNAQAQTRSNSLKFIQKSPGILAFYSIPGQARVHPNSRDKIRKCPEFLTLGNFIPRPIFGQAQIHPNN